MRRKHIYLFMPIRLLLCVCLGLSAAMGAAFADEQVLAGRLKQPGTVLMVRHALAPGFGDPDEFVIGQCATQRNLNDEGRRQAMAMGEWLRANAINKARMFSSQWCRCLETARLMDLGEVEQLPGLNSFHGRPRDREPNLARLKTFLSRQDPDGPLMIMSTHQVTIHALTNDLIASGHGAVFELGRDGEMKFLGKIGFGQ